MMKQSSALGDFFNRMIEKNYDFVLVAAAGNDSTQNTSHPIAKYGSHLEARYNSPLCMIEQAEYPGVYDRIIVVGALEMNYDPVAGTSTIDIAGYSNGGVRTDIYAPGSKIYSTYPGDSYDTMTGTSMAAPHVTGVAAMVWSANNGLTGAEVKDIICNNPMPIYSEFKMLDAYGSVCAALKTQRGINYENDEGAAFGYVQIKGITNLKVKDACVTLTSTSDASESYEGITDMYGHYEIVAPAGEYDITVTADGFYDYASKKPITLNSREITYVDKIKLKKLKIKNSGGGKAETTTVSAKETPEIGKIYTGEDIKKFLPDKFGKFDIGIGLDKIRAWTYYEGHYYAIFDYAMSAKVMTLATKQDPNVHLVTITSEEEQQLIEELMLYGERDVYYTGGLVDEDGDVYTVNGEDTDYTHWYTDCPENYGKEDKDDIIAIYRGAVDEPKSSPDYGYWFDLNEDEYNLFDFADFNVEGATRGIIIEWDTPILETDN
ncbi:MAG: S8 family serine peptidase [Ruminococcus sp.]|nr:S8 family serine peptidase [Ruminococcus sp.]